MSLVQMSFSGAVLILAIAVIRLAAVDRLPKGIFLLLWKVVLVRLLVPFSIPSMFSVYSLVGQTLSGRTSPGTWAGNVISIIPREQVHAVNEAGQLSAASPAVSS